MATSRNFLGWLAGTGGSIAFTTYQASKLFLLGLNPDGSLSGFERTFERCMGLGVGADGASLALATRYQIQRFDNLIPAGAADPGRYDAMFAPHAAWVTGDVDAHDIGFGGDGRPVFVNTLFACAAVVARSDSAYGRRDHRRDGGIVIDIATNEALARSVSNEAVESVPVLAASTSVVAKGKTVLSWLASKFPMVSWFTPIEFAAM